MSLLTHLTDTASKLIITQTERNTIDGYIQSLKTKLGAYFASDTFSEQLIFGSFARKTLMPRKADYKSDVDFMLVFKNSTYQPGTYLKWLKDFAEAKYVTSEIYHSHPTVVLELSKIKIELVPAIKSTWDDYQIPAPSSSYSTWMPTHPYAFNSTLQTKNSNEKSLIRPLIRIMKYWNASNDWVYSSYELENLITNHNYFFCNNLWDYFYSLVSSLSIYSLPTYKANKVEKLKKIVEEAKKLNADGMPYTAEIKLKEAIPFY